MSCMHSWVPVPEASARSRFVFRCFNCRAIVEMKLTPERTATPKILDAGRAGLQLDGLAAFAADVARHMLRDHPDHFPEAAPRRVTRRARRAAARADRRV